LKNDLVRWILVLPVALVVWGGILVGFIVFINAPIYSTLMNLLYGDALEILKEFVLYAIAPYWSVIASANVAPKNSYIVSIIIGLLIVLVQFSTVYLVQISGVNTNWLWFGTLVMAIAVTVAIRQVRKNSQ